MSAAGPVSYELEVKQLETPGAVAIHLVLLTPKRRGGGVHREGVFDAVRAPWVAHALRQALQRGCEATGGAVHLRGSFWEAYLTARRTAARARPRQAAP